MIACWNQYMTKISLSPHFYSKSGKDKPDCQRRQAIQLPLTCMYIIYSLYSKETIPAPLYLKSYINNLVLIQIEIGFQSSHINSESMGQSFRWENNKLERNKTELPHQVDVARLKYSLLKGKRQILNFAPDRLLVTSLKVKIIVVEIWTIKKSNN